MRGKPKFDLNLFRRDVYQLAATLGIYERERLSGLPETEQLVSSRFAGEMNRQLLLVAISARRLFETADIAKNKKLGHCGQYQEQAISKPDSGTHVPIQPALDETSLKFAGLELAVACNSIIHAKEIYIQPKSDYYAPKFKLKGTDTRFNKEIGATQRYRTEAELEAASFLECCMSLCSVVERALKGKVAKKQSAPQAAGKLN